ncbi:MAG: FAD-dependent oxidoreductase [Lentisphaerae bacterium]|nr:FAD-dependent oxidoreductase [Lentisphaerota bacterium]
MSNSTKTLNYNRELPVRGNYDVLVAGGGPAGMTAAVAAARQGCSVRLIEAHTCLGGLGTAGMVPAFMPFTDGVNFLAGGLGREILDRLTAANGTIDTRWGAVNIKAEVFKRVCDDMLVEAGVEFTFHTQLTDVITEDGNVTTAICAAKSGMFAIKAKTFIDCTGDGDLSVYAGASYVKGDDNEAMMPGTLCSLWAGIDWEKVMTSGLGSGNMRIEEAFKDNVFTLEDRHLPGMYHVGNTLGGGNIGHTFNLDGTDETSITKALLWGRKSLQEYERYYKEYLKGFENMELVATGSLLGVRETRRITGDYELDIDDFVNKAVFDDEIGRFSYPVDIHIARPDKESYEKFTKEITTLNLGKGESYGIPYRILLPKGLKNTLVAGRCVSTDRNVQASIRVMPGCFITGQAAGVAAALSVRDNIETRKVNVRELQSILKDMGAYLPNYSS